MIRFATGKANRSPAGGRRSMIEPFMRGRTKQMCLPAMLLIRKLLIEDRHF